MKYKIGFVYNPGYGSRGEQDIRCTVFCGLFEGEADKLPTIGVVWKQIKDLVKDYTVLRKINQYDDKPLKPRKLMRKDIYIVDPTSYLYAYTGVHKNICDLK